MTLSVAHQRYATEQHEQLMEIFYKHLEIPDPDWLDTVLAVALHSTIRDRNDMLWIVLVGDASTGKTLFGSDIFQRLISHAYNLGSLTTKSFVTGYKNAKDSLPEMDRKLVLIKDLSSITAINTYARGEIFSQLRQIYDGNFSVIWGSDKHRVSYSVIFDLIACVTKRDWDRVNAVEGPLGERMMPVYQRIGQDAREAILERAQRNNGNSGAIMAELADAVSQYVDMMQLIVPYYQHVTMQDDVMSGVRLDSIIADKIRIGIEYEYERGTKSQIGRYSQSAGSRFIATVTTLLKLIAVIHGNERVTDYELGIAHRLYYSLTPSTRMCVVEILYHHNAITAKGLAEAILLPESTARKILNELAALELLSTSKGSNKETIYLLNPEFREDLDRSRFLSGGPINYTMSMRDIAREMMNIPRWGK